MEPGNTVPHTEQIENGRVTDGGGGPTVKEETEVEAEDGMSDSMKRVQKCTMVEKVSRGAQALNIRHFWRSAFI